MDIICYDSEVNMGCSCQISCYVAAPRKRVPESFKLLVDLCEWAEQHVLPHISFAVTCLVKLNFGLVSVHDLDGDLDHIIIRPGGEAVIGYE